MNGTIEETYVSCRLATDGTHSGAALLRDVCQPFTKVLSSEKLRRDPQVAGNWIIRVTYELDEEMQDED